MSNSEAEFAGLSESKRALLALLLEEAGVEGASDRAIPRRQVGAQRVPLSFAQQRLWLLDQLAPKNPAYNVPIIMRLAGSLNVRALERALNEIVRRHEVLRTAFAVVNGQPAQVIAPALVLTLTVRELDDLVPGAREERAREEEAREEEAREEEAREEEARNWAVREGRGPFDLARGPLIRAGLLRLGPDDHMLLLTLHHIVFDGWSLGILKRELAALYGAYCAGRGSPLPEPSIQYADFAVWQRQRLTGAALEEHLAYWRRHLEGGPPALELGGDRPRPAAVSFCGALAERLLPAPLGEQLAELGRREGATPFMALAAGLMALLHRYTGQDDVVIGPVIAGRSRAEVEPLIGFFVNLLPLRAWAGDDPSFGEFLRRVREATIGALAHQDLPFEKLVEALRPERDPSRQPVVQVGFALQNAPDEPCEMPGLEVAFPRLDIGTAKLDLTVSVEETPRGLLATAEYSTDLYDAVTAARLLRHLENLLAAAAAEPGRRLSELALMDASERRRVVVEWNQTRRDPPRRLAHELFQERAREAPDAVAAVFRGLSVTYREIDRRSNQLARHLRALGVGPETLVAVCIERSPEMIIAVLGVLKAGGAYLPLDPADPGERLAFMMEDAKARLLLTGGTPPALPRAARRRAVSLNGDRQPIARRSDAPLDGVVGPRHLAYAIYTSGSTGTPKGVLVEHGALANLIQSAIAALDLGPGGRVLQLTPLTFDPWAIDCLAPLAAGATLFLAPAGELRDPHALARLLGQKAPDVAALPPAMLGRLDAATVFAPRAVIVGGEACWPDKAVDWARRARLLINAYGPTEATVVATSFTVPSDAQTDRPLPIGRPWPNVRTYILDDRLNPVPPGVRGELFIAGAGVARGYLGRPALTAERFLPDPFGAEPGAASDAARGARMYRTGDLARYRDDGNIEFLGRVDDQIKLRGYRIELGEVEAALARHPAVADVVVALRAAAEADAAVAARGDRRADARLVAYIVARPGRRPPTAAALRAFLGRTLSPHMVPSAYVALARLPLAPSGKVDRRALPDPGAARPSLGRRCVAPRGAAQRRLAAIFAGALRLEGVGARDSFFDLGGNSLQAAQVMAQVRDVFGVDLPLRDMLAAPTVSGLAARVDRARRLGGPPQEATPAPWSVLVTVQPGAGRPFFCAHPVGGGVFHYANLARCLGHDLPFFGFQSPGLEDKCLPLGSVEAMAARYVEALRAVQPQGPYLVGGWSMGGVVAFEMAHRLREAGHEVALLAVLDASPPGGPLDPPPEVEYVLAFARDIAGALGQKLPLAADELEPLSAGDRLALVLGRARASGALPPDFSAAQMSQRFAVFRANARAMILYLGRPYAGRIALFRAAGSPDTAAGWRALAGGGLDVDIVPGNHYSMLAQPHVAALAAALRARIDAARPD